MVRRVLVLALAGGCRLGFDSTGDARGDDDADAIESTGKPDSTPPIDGDPAIDSPIGAGSYTVTESTEPYSSPSGAAAIPGFTVDSDDEGFVLALPFPFVFYGITYREVTASVNGFLTFGAGPVGEASFANDCPFDASTPDAMIAVFWDDLYAPDAAPTSSFVAAGDGVSPDRRFTIEWRDLDAFYQAGGGNNSFGQGLRVTHKVTLHESGAIELHYGPRTPPTQDRDCGTDRHLGCSATVGLEAPGDLLVTAIGCGTAAGPAPGFAPLVEGRLIRFDPR